MVLALGKDLNSHGLSFLIFKMEIITIEIITIEDLVEAQHLLSLVQCLAHSKCLMNTEGLPPELVYQEPTRGQRQKHM